MVPAQVSETRLALSDGVCIEYIQKLEWLYSNIYIYMYIHPNGIVHIHKKMVVYKLTILQPFVSKSCAKKTP